MNQPPGSPYQFRAGALAAGSVVGSFLPPVCARLLSPSYRVQRKYPSPSRKAGILPPRIGILHPPVREGQERQLPCPSGGTGLQPRNKSHLDAIERARSAEVHHFEYSHWSVLWIGGEPGQSILLKGSSCEY